MSSGMRHEMLEPMKPFDPAPGYQQVAETLRQEISQGIYKDERLPTQDALAKRFDVSRVTIQRALTDLRNEGVIYSLKGKGIFVAPTNLPAPSVRERLQEDLNSPSGQVLYCYFTRASTVCQLVNGLVILDPKLRPLELRALVDSWDDDDVRFLSSTPVPGLRVELRDYWAHMPSLLRLTTGEVAMSLGSDDEVLTKDAVAWMQPTKGIQDNVGAWFDFHWNDASPAQID